MRRSTLPIIALALSWAGTFLLGLYWTDPWGQLKAVTIALGPLLVAAVFATDWIRRKTEGMVHEHRRRSAR
jgi:hypothetical protein